MFYQGKKCVVIISIAKIISAFLASLYTIVTITIVITIVYINNGKTFFICFIIVIIFIANIIIDNGLLKLPLQP